MKKFDAPKEHKDRRYLEPKHNPHIDMQELKLNMEKILSRNQKNPGKISKNSSTRNSLRSSNKKRAIAIAIQNSKNPSEEDDMSQDKK